MKTMESKGETANVIQRAKEYAQEIIQRYPGFDISLLIVRAYAQGWNDKAEIDSKY